MAEQFCSCVCVFLHFLHFVFSDCVCVCVNAPGAVDKNKQQFAFAWPTVADTANLSVN